MRKVLIIDDEPAIAAFMAALIESELGFAPVVACNEETALESISSFDYDLIISDSLSFRPDLPQERGGDRWRWIDLLCKQVEARGPHVPILLMTAYPRHLFEAYAAHGLKGFIAKPFNLQETIQEILKAITSVPHFSEEEHELQFNGLIGKKAAAALQLNSSRLSSFVI